MYTKNKIEEKCTQKIFIIKHIKKWKNLPQKYKKCKNAHRNFKNHTKNPKNDISGITDILGDNRYIARSFTYWLSPITSFHHHIGYPRYYRDILESVPFLTPYVVPGFQWSGFKYYHGSNLSSVTIRTSQGFLNNVLHVWWPGKLPPPHQNTSVWWEI